MPVCVFVSEGLGGKGSKRKGKEEASPSGEAAGRGRVLEAILKSHQRGQKLEAWAMASSRLFLA